MEYNEDLEKSGEITRMILPTLARLSIPINPVNFALWYEYYLGRSDDLNAKLDAVSNGVEAFTPELAAELFSAYVLNPDAEKVHRIGSEVKRLLAEVLKLVSEAGVDVGRFDGALDTCDKHLQQMDNIDQLGELVSGLVSETKSMMKSNERFQHQLSDTAADISLLREELAAMREQVSLDPLTGVANRKTFDDTLGTAVQSADSHGGDLCLMMVDVDFFKKINDEHGHLIGDKVIKYVAATLKKMVKGRDLVGRYGGEEFGIILHETPMAGAKTVAENIRLAIERSKLKRTDTGEPLGQVTVSIGVTAYRQGDTTESLLSRSDKALYESKNGGRNRVSCLT